MSRRRPGASAWRVTTPTLVVWGDSDRIADADYGRAFAAAIPGARFQLLRGHGTSAADRDAGQLLDAVSALWKSNAKAR